MDEQMTERIKQDYEVILDAWKLMKTAMTDESDSWRDRAEKEFMQLYRKHDAAHDDFAYKILDAVIAEVFEQKEKGSKGK